MRTIIVLEYDAETTDELDATVTKVRRDVPARGLCAIRVATVKADAIEDLRKARWYITRELQKRGAE